MSFIQNLVSRLVLKRRIEIQNVFILCTTPSQKVPFTKHNTINEYKLYLFHFNSTEIMRSLSNVWRGDSSLPC